MSIISNNKFFSKWDCLNKEQLSLSFPEETRSFANAGVEWEKTPAAEYKGYYVFKVAGVAGLKSEEVAVKIEGGGGVVCISGERSLTTEQNKQSWLRVETNTAKFLRRFTLPTSVNVQAHDIKKFMNNGVLTITLPKYI